MLVNNQIHSLNTRFNNETSILRLNGSKTKYCILHNGMITCNSVPDALQVNGKGKVFYGKEPPS